MEGGEGDAGGRGRGSLTARSAASGAAGPPRGSAGDERGAHLADRSAVGVVVERPVAPKARDVGSRVEAVCAEVDAVHPGRGCELRRAGAGRLGAVGLEARRDLLAGIPHRRAVHVGRRRRRGRRGVGNLVGRRLGYEDVAQGDAERLRRHLRHLGVQPLPHLHAAVGHEAGAVRVHVDERARLVEHLGGEGDAKLGRRRGQPALAEAVLGIESADGLPPALQPPRLLEHLLPADRDPVELELLPVVRKIALAVEVELPDLLWGLPKLPCDALHDLLYHHHPLRAAKASEGRVGGLIGPTDVPDSSHVGDPVAVVNVQQRAVHDRGAQVERVARVVVEVGIQGDQTALRGEAHLVARQESVPLPGRLHVLVAVEDEAHRPARVVCRNGAGDVTKGPAGLFPPKPAAEPLCFGDNLVGGNPEAPSDDLLVLGRSLS
mmetsp:Transcript_11607/g.27570  ORF Transcript_11607/g.27570 Transcript_11607/m.27570 type:complete len:435 (-) Transcript_11607:526-1830(-)